MKKKTAGIFSILLLVGTVLPLALALLVFGQAAISLNQHAFEPYTAEEQDVFLKEFKARNFGTPGEYSLMELVDVERGYFAVKGVNEGDTWKVMDEEGNVLLSTGISSYISQSGSYLFDRNGTGNRYVDLDAMKVVETGYKNLMIHGSGEYMTGKLSDMDAENRYVIQTMDGRVLYRGDQKAVLTSDYGFAILNGVDSGRALNLETGEILYESESGWLLEDRIDGIWTAVQVKEQSWHEDVLQLMDAEFRPVLPGKLFRRVVCSEDYICGDLYVNGTERIAAAAFLWNGQQLLQAEEREAMIYLDGDYFCYISLNTPYLTCVDLKTLKGGE